jgi:hypothetical protein
MMKPRQIKVVADRDSARLQTDRNMPPNGGNEPLRRWFELGVAISSSHFILVEVRFDLKILCRAIIPVAAIVLLCGCGGVRGSHSVSPASFFLPGLIQVDPKPENSEFPPAEADPIQELARAD